MSTTTLAPDLSPHTPLARQQMLVIWQHPRSRAMESVALLERSPSGYALRYLRRSRDVHEFRPLLGFADLGRAYHSSHLFPLFAGRVMSARRPDYADYLQALDLPPEAGPWEQLARSEGSQVTDALQVFPLPVLVGDQWHCRFLVHGTRHVPAAETSKAWNPDVEQHLADLRPGDPLLLRDDPDNAINPAAVVTCDRAQHALGWVPNFLVDHVAALRCSGDLRARAATVNGPDTPGHLRLAVELMGSAPDDYRPFGTEGYQPLA